MQTLQLTIEEPLLEEVDRLTAALNTTRSDFIRDALQAAIRKHTITLLEKQHAEGYAHHPVEPGDLDITLLEKQDAEGYARHPVEPSEFDIWLTEQVWDEE